MRIYKRKNGAHTVVLSELTDNTGESITSACEAIATDLVFAKRLNPKSTRWIQHDLPYNGQPQSFDELTFEWGGDDTASDPQWAPLTADQAESLTGDSLTDLSQRLGDLSLPAEEEM